MLGVAPASCRLARAGILPPTGAGCRRLPARRRRYRNNSSLLSRRIIFEEKLRKTCHHDFHERQQRTQRSPAARGVDCQPQGQQHGRQFLPDALCPPGRDHRRDGVHRPPRKACAGTGARRSGPRPHDHSRQHQSSRTGADVHRRGLAVQDQRQHRQLGGHLEH